MPQGLTEEQIKALGGVPASPRRREILPPAPLTEEQLRNMGARPSPVTPDRLFGALSTPLVPPEEISPQGLGEEIRQQGALPGQTPFQHGVDVFAAGVSGDIGKTLSSFTSPLGIGTLAAGASGRIPGAAGKIVRGAEGVAGAGFAAEATNRLLSPPEGEQYPEKVGRILESTSQLILGGTVGATRGASAYRTVKKLADVSPEFKSRVAGRIINSIIEPHAKDFQFGRNPGLEIAQRRIVANTVPGLASKVSAELNDIGDQIGRVVRNVPKAADGRPLNIQNIDLRNSVNGPIDKAISLAKDRGDTALVKRLNKYRNAQFERRLGRLTDRGVTEPEGAWKYLQEIKDETRFKEGVSYTVQDNMMNSVKRDIYQNLRAQIDSALPELVPLNESYGNLLTADNSIRRAIAVKQADSITPAIFWGSGLIAGSVLGGPLGGTLGAVVGGSIPALTGTAAKTRVAKYIAPEKIPTRPPEFAFERMLGPGATRSGAAPEGQIPNRPFSPADFGTKAPNRLLTEGEPGVGRQTVSRTPGGRPVASRGPGGQSPGGTPAFPVGGIDNVLLRAGVHPSALSSLTPEMKGQLYLELLRRLGIQ